MDCLLLKTAFDGALLWGCGLGLVGVALAALAHGLARVPARVRAAVRRYGLSAVLVLGGFASLATVFAQKSANVSTDFTDLHGSGERLATNRHETQFVIIRVNPWTRP